MREKASPSIAKGKTIVQKEKFACIYEKVKIERISKYKKRFFWQLLCNSCKQNNTPGK